MKHLFKNKRTKGLLWVLGGVCVVAAAVFIYGYSTGALKSSASTAPSFTDVPVGYWAYDAIGTDAQFGMISGYPDGTFRPTQLVTRDQAAVFMARAVAGNDSWVPNGPTTAHCSDVPTSNWAYKHVEYLIKQSVINKDCTILKGVDTASKFKPTQNLTRQEVSVLIARAISGETAIPAGPGIASFSDVSVSNPAYKYIEYLYKLGAVSGYGDRTFRPTATVTRDQMAVFLYKAYDLKNISSIIDSLAATTYRGAISRAYATIIPVDPSSQTYFGTLTGQVTDKNTGKPISGATVKFACSNGNKVFSGTNVSVTTDSNGNYSVKLDTRVMARVKFVWGLAKASKVVLVFKYTATAPDGAKVEGLSWNDRPDNSILGVQNFQQTGAGTHLECDSAKKCVSVPGGTSADNKCSKDADCVTTPVTPPPYTGLTGALSGPVCLKGMGDIKTTDTVCQSTGYHVFKPGVPKDTMFSFTLTPTPAGWTNGNAGGMVNGVGYLIKSPNTIAGLPDYIKLPVGSYTASNVELAWPTPYGLKGAKGDKSYSFSITSGNRTNVKWYMTVQ